MFAREVFVAGGLPRHTYNPREDLRLEQQLRDHLEAGFKVISITGPTKSGKTVLVKTMLPTTDSLWIPGGPVGSDESTFWEILLQRMDLYNQTGEDLEEGIDRGVEGGFKAEANLGVAKLEINTGASRTGSRSRTTSRNRVVSAKIAALEALGEHKLPLIIDDFHYMSADVQGSIIRSLREPIFEGLSVIILAVPHRRFDAIRVEREMTGRMVQIEVPFWTQPELLAIPEKGFALLNAECPIEL